MPDAVLCRRPGRTKSPAQPVGRGSEWTRRSCGSLRRHPTRPAGPRHRQAALAAPGRCRHRLARRPPQQPSTACCQTSWPGVAHRDHSSPTQNHCLSGGGNLWLGVSGRHRVTAQQALSRCSPWFSDCSSKTALWEPRAPPRSPRPPQTAALVQSPSALRPCAPAAGCHHCCAGGALRHGKRRGGLPRASACCSCCVQQRPQHLAWTAGGAAPPSLWQTLAPANPAAPGTARTCAQPARTPPGCCAAQSARP